MVKAKSLMGLLVLIGLICAQPLFGQSIAEWHTSMGMFRAEIREDLVPITGNNFIDLTNDNFYDGLYWHRVVEDFVIQDGWNMWEPEPDPIPLEIHPDLRHDAAGVLAMARASDPNSATSQYYFTLSPQPGLDDNYAVFGECVYGLDVILAIGEVPTIDEVPIDTVWIDSVRIIGNVYPHIDLLSSEIDDDPENSDDDGVLNPLESGNLIVEIKNVLDFADAENTVGVLRCEDDRVSIPDSIVEFGTIANGDSLTNADDPFTIVSTVNEVFSTKLTLHLTANPDGDYPYEIDHTIPFSVSLNQYGWPRQISGSTSSGLILDINGDGENEVIFGDDAGGLHAVQVDGETELSGFPVDLEDNISAAVAVDDIDDDDYLEIVAGTFGNQLLCVDYTGDILFSYSTSGQFRGNPMIADVDGNGTKEIIGVTLSGQMIVLDSDGNDYGNFPVNVGPGVLSPPAIADLDGDGYLDIIVLNSISGGSIYAISTSNGEAISGWPLTLGSGSLRGPIVADINSDESVEVLVGLSNGEFFAINSDGSTQFSRNIGVAINTSVLAADVDQNGSMEIVFVANDGSVYVMDNQGNDLYDFPISVETVVQSSPILADLNDNGTQDIIFGDNEGDIHAIDVSGDAIDPFPVHIGGILQTSPAIGELDGDNDPEIIIPNDNYYFVIDYKQSATIGWPCFKANPRRTGNAAQVYTGIEAENMVNTPVKTTFLGNNYPNPFNPETIIRFGLAKKSLVTLKIYDLSGRLVRTLIDGDLREGGYHAVRWNGNDENGDSVGSGMYIYKMETDEYRQTRRMILLK